MKEETSESLFRLDDGQVFKGHRKTVKGFGKKRKRVLKSTKDDRQPMLPGLESVATSERLPIHSH